MKQSGFWFYTQPMQKKKHIRTELPLFTKPLAPGLFSRTSSKFIKLQESFRMKSVAKCIMGYWKSRSKWEIPEARINAIFTTSRQWGLTGSVPISMLIQWYLHTPLELWKITDLLYHTSPPNVTDPVVINYHVWFTVHRKPDEPKRCVVWD